MVKRNYSTFTRRTLCFYQSTHHPHLLHHLNFRWQRSHHHSGPKAHHLRSLSLFFHKRIRNNKLINTVNISSVIPTEGENACNNANKKSTLPFFYTESSGKGNHITSIPSISFPLAAATIILALICFRNLLLRSATCKSSPPLYSDTYFSFLGKNCIANLQNLSSIYNHKDIPFIQRTPKNSIVITEKKLSILTKDTGNWICNFKRCLP